MQAPYFTLKCCSHEGCQVTSPANLKYCAREQRYDNKPTDSHWDQNILLSSVWRSSPDAQFDGKVIAQSSGNKSVSNIHRARKKIRPADRLIWREIGQQASACIYCRICGRI